MQKKIAKEARKNAANKPNRLRGKMVRKILLKFKGDKNGKKVNRVTVFYEGYRRVYQDLKKAYKKGEVQL